MNTGDFYVNSHSGSQSLKHQSDCNVTYRLVPERTRIEISILQVEINFSVNGGERAKTQYIYLPREVAYALTGEYPTSLVYDKVIKITESELKKHDEEVYANCYCGMTKKLSDATP